ncbi:MAG: cation:proton antiporter [Gemmatimonadota bacterium]|nr:cation:proton antiporter [Gemmatimonadota bacterium]MDH3427344.1 cation:proton antiporter [Gemmatimonadota bacterium]
MRTLLAALALTVLSLVGARLAFPARQSSVGVRLFLSSGSHFVVFGLLLGPRMSGLLTDEVLQGLAAFVALGLGWIGLLFGLQFERGALKAFRHAEVGLVFGEALATLLVLGAGGAVLLYTVGLWSTDAAPFLLAAAAAGCVSSPTGAAVVFGSTRVSGPVARLSSLCASLDGVVGLLALAIVFAAFHPFQPPGALDVGRLRWILTPLLLALIFGWLFYSLTRDRIAPQEFVLFLLGLALVLGGSNLVLGTSALFAASLTGILIANVSPIRRRTFATLVAWEKPVHVLFLLLAGSLLSLSNWMILPLLLAYVLLRIGGKYVGGIPARRLIAPSPAVSRFGLALISQGGLSVAIAVSALLTLGTTIPNPRAAALMFDVVVLGVMANELIGPPLLKRVLADGGELAAPG